MLSPQALACEKNEENEHRLKPAVASYHCIMAFYHPEPQAKGPSSLNPLKRRFFAAAGGEA
jgi:hypothetical protein